MGLILGFDSKWVDKNSRLMLINKVCGLAPCPLQVFGGKTRVFLERLRDQKEFPLGEKAGRRRKG